MQNMVTLLTSACLFGGQGTITQIDVFPKRFLFGGPVVFHSFEQVTRKKQSLNHLTQGQREESEHSALSGFSKRQKKSEGKGSQMPGEVVKSYRSNNTLLFIAGPAGWVTEEESGLCLSV